MDQVVDRAIAREKALIELMNAHAAGRNLSSEFAPDPAWVRCRKKITISSAAWIWARSVDRRDYMSKEASLESTLLGGVTKLFKFEYRPMGFSWMVYADRWDFDRQHYTSNMSAENF